MQDVPDVLVFVLLTPQKDPRVSINMEQLMNTAFEQNQLISQRAFCRSECA